MREKLPEPSDQSPVTRAQTEQRGTTLFLWVAGLPSPSFSKGDPPPTKHMISLPHVITSHTAQKMCRPPQNQALGSIPALFPPLSPSFTKVPEEFRVSVLQIHDLKFKFSISHMHQVHSGSSVVSKAIPLHHSYGYVRTIKGDTAPMNTGTDPGSLCVSPADHKSCVSNKSLTIGEHMCRHHT